MSATYLDKLKDPRWQRKRLEILERDDFTCRACRDTTTTLHVHHCAYTTPDPWDEPDHNLVTFCETCHNEETDEWLAAVAELEHELRRNCCSSDSVRALTWVIHFVGTEYASTVPRPNLKAYRWWARSTFDEFTHALALAVGRDDILRQIMLISPSFRARYEGCEELMEN